jgi:hypothetical protein
MLIELDGTAALDARDQYDTTPLPAMVSRVRALRRWHRTCIQRDEEMLSGMAFSEQYRDVQICTAP